MPTRRPHLSRAATGSAISPEDIALLLDLFSGDDNSWFEVWGLAGRLALQLPEANFAATVRDSVARMAREGALGPIRAMIGAILQSGSADRLALLDPSILAPLFASDREHIREWALGVLSRWPGAES